MRTVLVSAVLLAVLPAGAAIAQPCAYEDSSWCYWNASDRGNGQGSSFVSLIGGHKINL